MSGTITHHRKLLGMAKNWALKTLPGWSDAVHRDLLARHGAQRDMRVGRYSATTMTLPQLLAALADYGARGWHRAPMHQATGKPSDQIRHIVRLWARLGQAGRVDSATRQALLAWIGRQLGKPVSNLDVLTDREGQRLIEALKAWGGR